MNDGQNIRQLTGLRFFAAYWVVLFHYWPKLQGAQVPVFVEKGYLGVELFFILSGFILCHVYRTSVAEARYRYGGFLWNRLARIYPLHLATLIGMGVMALAATAAGFAVDPNILSWKALPANLLLLHAWGFADTAGWNHPSWSISAEWFAYLTFPAFAWAALKLKDRPVLAAAAAILFMIGLYGIFERLAGFPLTRATIAWGALRIVPCFAFGCALHGLWKARPARSRGWALGLVAGSLAATTAMAANGAPDALIVVGLGIVILALGRLAQTGSMLLGSAPLVYLGEISYSVYMICVPWMIISVNGISKFMRLESDNLPIFPWLMMLVGVIPLSAASYHLIEKPARQGMKALSDNWSLRRSRTASV